MGPAPLDGHAFDGHAFDAFLDTVDLAALEDAALEAAAVQAAAVKAAVAEKEKEVKTSSTNSCAARLSPAVTRETVFASVNTNCTISKTPSSVGSA